MEMGVGCSWRFVKFVQDSGTRFGPLEMVHHGISMENVKEMKRATWRTSLQPGQ